MMSLGIPFTFIFLAADSSRFVGATKIKKGVVVVAIADDDSAFRGRLIEFWVISFGTGEVCDSASAANKVDEFDRMARAGMSGESVKGWVRRTEVSRS